MYSQSDKITIREMQNIANALKHRARLLKYHANFVIISSILNVFVSLITVSIYVVGSYTQGTISDISYIFFIINIFTLALALVFLFRFDQQRKTGDIIFEEASDFYEWLLKRQISDDQLPKHKTILLTLKIAFREYTRSSDLPLFPGKRGVSQYSLINIMVIFILGFSLIIMTIKP
jgi:hypothetical protein